MVRSGLPAEISRALGVLQGKEGSGGGGKGSLPGILHRSSGTICSGNRRVPKRGAQGRDIGKAQSLV